MTDVRLYAPALVLFLWAALLSLGVHGEVAVAVGLLGTAAATTAAELERKRLRSDLRREIRNARRRRAAL